MRDPLLTKTIPAAIDDYLAIAAPFAQLDFDFQQMELAELLRVSASRLRGALAAAGESRRSATVAPPAAETAAGLPRAITRRYY